MGWPVVIDCANGATAPHAPGLFRSLGLDVRAIGVEPNGRNINLNCGSTHLDALARAVAANGARLGVAFDGDGDRALLVDHHGKTVDGDAIMLMAARHLQHEGRLPDSTVVATVMSNIGLELALTELGITMLRTPVGDKYVMEEMSRRGLALGGEQSGHIILAEHLFTGDGIATALFVLKMIARVAVGSRRPCGGHGELSASARERSGSRAVRLHAGAGDREPHPSCGIRSERAWPAPRALFGNPTRRMRPVPSR